MGERETRRSMGDWVFLSNENLSDDEEVVLSTDIENQKESVYVSNDNESVHFSDDDETTSYSDDNESLSDYEDEFSISDTPVSRLTQTLQLVLPRLPAKSLLRFKSVSPHFESLISSPFFILSHSIHPKHVLGLFYHSFGVPCYVSFHSRSDIDDPGLRFLPEAVTIKASTRGMLCLRGRESYYVVNPVTKEWVELPKPSAHHGDDVAVVILFDEPFMYNFGADYQVVCAYPVIQGVYTFERFSSKTWKWTQSSEICDVENIVAASGVAVGAAAYWRTTMQTILEYKPAPPEDNNESTENNTKRDMCRILFHEIDPSSQCELGEMEGDLCITTKSCNGRINVQVMHEINGRVRWENKGGFWVENWSYRNGRIAILRTQGKAGVVAGEDDDPIFTRGDFYEESEEKKELSLRNIDGKVLSYVIAPAFCAHFFPFIPTLLPVRKKRSIKEHNVAQVVKRSNEEPSTLYGNVAQVVKRSTEEASSSLANVDEAGNSSAKEEASSLW